MSHCSILTKIFQAADGKRDVLGHVSAPTGNFPSQELKLRRRDLGVPLALQASRDPGKHPGWHGCPRPANVDGDGNLPPGSGDDTRDAQDTRALVEGERSRNTGRLCFRTNAAQHLFATPCSPPPGRAQRERPQARLPHPRWGGRGPRQHAFTASRFYSDSLALKCCRSLLDGDRQPIVSGLGGGKAAVFLLGGWEK